MLKRWAAYYLVLMAALAFALIVPGRTSSAFFYAILALPVVSLCSALLMLGCFRFEQRLERTSAVKGDTVNYWLTVKNRCPLMIPRIEASFRGEFSAFGEGIAAMAFSVSPLAMDTFKVPLCCKYRGSYEFGLQQIRLSDYLGLFSFRHNVAALGVLTVYPRILPAEGFPLMAGMASVSGRHAARSHESTDNVSDIRKYASGDRLRSVHWKLSAKKDELMVKNYEQMAGESLEMMLDASGICGSAEEVAAAEDRLVECAVSLAWHCAARSAPVTVWYYAGQAEKHTIRSMKDFNAAYHLLAEARFNQGQVLPDRAALVEGYTSGGKTAAFAAVSLNGDVCARALKARASGCRATVILASLHPDAEIQDAESVDNLAVLLHAGVPVLSMGADGGLKAVLAERAHDAG